MNNFPVFSCLTGSFTDDFAVDFIHPHKILKPAFIAGFFMPERNP